MLLCDMDEASSLLGLIRAEANEFDKVGGLLPEVQRLLYRMIDGRVREMAEADGCSPVPRIAQSLRQADLRAVSSVQPVAESGPGEYRALDPRGVPYHAL